MGGVVRDRPCRVEGGCGVIPFLVGVVFGGCVGAFVVALCVAASKGDGE